MSPPPLAKRKAGSNLPHLAISWDEMAWGSRMKGEYESLNMHLQESDCDAACLPHSYLRPHLDGCKSVYFNDPN